MSSYQAPKYSANRLDPLAEANFKRQIAQNKAKRLRCAQEEMSRLMATNTETPDLVCLSHLRWDFVYQRPQHLLSRCAQGRRTFFVEEPIFEFTDTWWLELSQRECGVWVVVPHLPDFVNEDLAAAMMQNLLDELFAECAIANPVLWYYTPMAMKFSHHLSASAVVYDCMDELSAFRGAPPALQELERQLFERANVVFTGGQSLYEVKQSQHANVHAFPSSIDVAHFAQARAEIQDPADQADIPHPRLGFYGVIDERMDLELLDGIAQARPDWHLVIIGPVVKIDPEQLPRHPNIHYLGGKNYQELPQYLAGWDVAILPFALNESTRFISPTKTPEYLAAGKPVVSTSIRDVVRPYGQQRLVHIANAVDDFVDAAELAMQQAEQDTDWRQQVDAFLANTSWDKTWNEMNSLIEAVSAQKVRPAEVKVAQPKAAQPKVAQPKPAAVNTKPAQKVPTKAPAKTPVKTAAKTTLQPSYASSVLGLGQSGNS